MKPHALPSILLISIFTVSGCYSQLKYSQSVYNRLPTPVHVSNGEDYAAEKMDSNYREENQDGYIENTVEYPYYYKDYAAAEWYASYGFDSQYYVSHYGINFYNQFFVPFSYLSATASFHTGRSRHSFYSYNTSSTSRYWVCWDPWDDIYYSYRPVNYHHPLTSVAIGYAGYFHPPKGGGGEYGRRTTGTRRVTKNRSGSRNTTREIAKISEPRTPAIHSSGSGDIVRSRASTTVRSRSGNGNSTGVRSTGRSSSGSSRGKRVRDN